MRRHWLYVPVVAIVISTACAHRPPRFIDGTVVTEAGDDRDIPQPDKNDFQRASHHLDSFFKRQIRVGLDPLPPRPAADVNRLGEVPNSAWYENRIDGLTAVEVARGPGGDDPGPENFRPWTITGMKVGGRNPGFIFEDSRGQKYICKFDKEGEPFVSTTAGVVASRLLWACGYYVPDNRVVVFQRSDLRISDTVTMETPSGRKIPLTDGTIDEVLRRVSARQDGGYRALASRFLPGRPIGGYSYRGTRSDDPNDTIRHQDRRSLRGLRVFGAWLNHVDQKIDNTLDLYTQENGRHFIRHYLVDFDGCLGGYWAARHEARIGYAYDFDWSEVVTGLPAFGLYKRPYEDLRGPAHPQIGLFEAETYNPAGWKANYVNDQIESCKPADVFWAGKVLAELSQAHIQAAVESGRFSDPAAEVLLTDILQRRWEKTVDWALASVTPVVDVEAVASGSSFGVEANDALRKYGRRSALVYQVRLFDNTGKRLHAWPDVNSPTVFVPSEYAANNDYLFIEWTAVDMATGQRLPPTQAHYLYGPTGWRLVGVLRDGE